MPPGSGISSLTSSGHDCAIEPKLSHGQTELARLNVVEPWACEVPYLLQLPRIRLVSAMTLLAASGDIARFPSGSSWWASN